MGGWGMAWTTCEDCDVILIEVVRRRHEGKFSKANFLPTQCRFSLSRIEKTFLTGFGSYGNVCLQTYFIFLESSNWIWTSHQGRLIYANKIYAQRWENEILKIFSWICNLLLLRVHVDTHLLLTFSLIHKHRENHLSFFLLLVLILFVRCSSRIDDVLLQ